MASASNERALRQRDGVEGRRRRWAVALEEEEVPVRLEHFQRTVFGTSSIPVPAHPWKTWAWASDIGLSMWATVTFVNMKQQQPPFGFVPHLVSLFLFGFGHVHVSRFTTLHHHKSWASQNQNIDRTQDDDLIIWKKEGGKDWRTAIKLILKNKVRPSLLGKAERGIGLTAAFIVLGW